MIAQRIRKRNRVEAAEPLTDEQREAAADPWFVSHINAIVAKWARHHWWVDRDGMASFLAEAMVVAVRNHDASKAMSLRSYVANRLGFAVRDYFRIHGTHGMGHAIGQVRKGGLHLRFESLSTVLAEDSRSVTIADNIGVPGDLDPDRTHSRAEAVAMLASLCERDREIVLGYVVDGLTMKQVAERAGISESRVSQLYARLIEELKDPVRRRLEATA